MGSALEWWAWALLPHFPSPLLPTRPLPAASPPGPLPRPQPWPFSVLLDFALPSPWCPLTVPSPLPLPQGIVGNLSSGKSALVHRYLTGTYVQEESPEGERPRLAWATPFLLCV